LLEIFLARFGDKRATSLQLIHDLYEALLKASAASAKASQQGSEEAAGEDGKGKGGKAKKQSKADSTLRRLEAGLAERLCKLLARVLRGVCRGPVIEAVAGWHSAEEWASKARALCALGQTQKMAGSGQKSLEVGSNMLYFLCAAHRAATSGEDANLAHGEGWTLAEELLGGVLREWGGKKDCDAWCQAALKAFAVRATEVLRRLGWMEQIRGSRKAFAQRSQVSFVASELLRPAAAGQEGPPASFVEGFTELLAELLESSLKEEGNAASSASQKQKLRREALLALKSVLRQRRAAHEKLAAAATISGAVAGVRDSLPNQQRRGEVYQLCLHILRIVRPQVTGAAPDKSTPDRSASPKRQKQKPSSSGDEASSKSAKKRKAGRSASQSPQLKPGSPALKPGSPSLKPQGAKKAKQ